MKALRLLRSVELVNQCSCWSSNTPRPTPGQALTATLAGLVLCTKLEAAVELQSSVQNLVHQIFVCGPLTSKLSTIAHWRPAERENAVSM